MPVASFLHAVPLVPFYTKLSHVTAWTLQNRVTNTYCYGHFYLQISPSCSLHFKKDWSTSTDIMTKIFHGKYGNHRWIFEAVRNAHLLTDRLITGNIV